MRRVVVHVQNADADGRLSGKRVFHGAVRNEDPNTQVLGIPCSLAVKHFSTVEAAVSDKEESDEIVLMFFSFSSITSSSFSSSSPSSSSA